MKTRRERFHGARLKVASARRAGMCEDVYRADCEAKSVSRRAVQIRARVEA